MGEQEQNSQEPSFEEVEPKPGDRALEEPIRTPDIHPQEGEQIADRNRRIGLYVLGFLGWFAVNGFVWLSGLAEVGFWLLMFPLNLVVPLLLLRKKQTREIGQGIFVAIGLNLIVSLVVGIFINGVCMIPFFYDGFLF